MAEPIDMPFGLKTHVGPGNHVLDEGPDPPWEESIWRGKGASHCKVWFKESTSSIVFVRWRQLCPHGKAHWHHLANTTEPSICGGDVVLCQTTLTTCYK